MKKLLFKSVKQPPHLAARSANRRKTGRLSAGILLAAFLGFQPDAQAQTCGTTVATFPHIQDFEGATTGSPGTLPTGWTQVTTPASSTYRWQVNAGATGSTATGPNVDHSLGTATGKYVYTEASNGLGNDVTELRTPCFNLTGLTTPGFEFWYHMAGIGMGPMNIDVSTNNGTTWTNLFTFTGPQQAAENDPWLKKTISLSAYTGQTVMLRFKGTKNATPPSSGFDFEGDMAIDDFKIFNIPSTDAELVAITSPNLSGCGFTATENVTISIKNNGNAPISNIPVRYVLGTNTINETTPASLTIAPGATGSYTFTAKANLAAGGTYNLTATVLLASDGDPSNDSKTRAIINPLVSTFPNLQDFETGVTGSPGTLPAGWSRNQSPASSTYQWYVNAGGTSSTATGPNVDHTSGTATGKYVYTEASNGGTTDEAYLISPCINLAGLTTPGFEFWYHMAGVDMGVLDVQVSSNGGTTWTTLHTFTGPQQATENDPWLKKTLSLAGYSGIVQIRWKGTKKATGNTFEGDIAIDDVKFFNIPPIDAELVAITAPAASSGCAFTATENVTISIKNNGNAPLTNIPVRYVLGATTVNETTPASFSIAPGATGTYTFTAKANLVTPATYTLTATVLATSDGDPSNDAKTRTITVVPNISTYPYMQNFDAGNGGWVASGTNSSWALGTPAKPVINSAGSGTNSWATNLTGTYNSSENSQVVGPCFNMSSLVQPIISMKVWWSSESGWDGTVLQSSIDGGLTWQNVGAFGDPDNWFNDNSLDNRAGGQSEGWAGTGTTSSGGWKIAKHNLTGLGGKPSVLLRIAFGSDGSVEYDGFAFDDVAIFESPANDVGIAAITAPAISGCGFTAAENVCITITNLGSSPTTTIPVSYQIGTNAPVNEVANLVIAPGATANYCFTTKANLSVVGTYNFTFTTALANDGNPTNNSATRSVTVVPTVASLPYTEGFENGNGGWVASGTNSSWAIGTPAKANINSAGSGSNSYVTSLTGTYSPSEDSHVLSPCFNFTGIPDPDFEMKAWWYSEGGWDGAVLQSSINGGQTWQNVGALNDPNNWYNEASLDGRAGGQDIGWSGTGTASSGGWVRVKHKLNGLGGQSSVRLRIAFGSDGSVDYDGFAFDDIRIGDNTGNLGINSFVPLTQLCGFGTNEKVEVILENFGSTPVSGYTVSYTVNGGAPVTAPTVPTLQPGVPVNFVFPVGANLSAPGNYTIVVTVTNPNDPEVANNTITYTIGNASYTALPPTFTFETAATGIAGLRTVTNSKSAITEGAAASLPLAGSPATSTKGMIMEGSMNPSWVMPVGITDPWTNNPEHFSAAYLCFSPTGVPAGSQLWLSLDLKQLYKTANANTNFRVTVNGAQVGPTYRPPFSGTPIDWQKVYVNLTSYKNLANIQVGLESSVAEPFAAGAGTANLIDNVRIHLVDPTGVSNEVFQSSINVYPNPSNGEFSVSVPAANAYTLEVTDLTGRIVKREVIRNSNSNVTKLDLKGQAQGVYLLKITSEGNSSVQKLVIE